MSLVRLVEGERRSPDAWRRDLGLADEVWEELVTEGVFAYARRGRAAEAILEFVGLVGLSDSLLACMPRVGIDTADPVGWLRRVLAAYFVGEGRRSRDDATLDLHHRDSSVFREIDALTTLLGYYASRGLYRRIVTTSTSRGSGAVDWGATLARCEPLIANGIPVYTEPLRWTRRAEANEVSHLQAAATTWLARRYEARLPSGLLDATAGIDVDARMAPNHAQFDLSLLARERAVTYLAADLRLLDALEAVVSGRRRMAGVAGARLYGTTAFAMVWEDAVRDLFGDDAADASLGEANWYDLQDGGWSGPTTAPGRRLDLLIRHGEEILLLDAKYHHPYPLVRPGWADIVKQLYYAESLVRDGSVSVRNAFLLPKAGQPVALASIVRVEEAARDFPPVEAWTLDPGWVFSAYGDGDLARRTRARRALATARDEVAEVLGDA